MGLATSSTVNASLIREDSPRHDSKAGGGLKGERGELGGRGHERETESEKAARARTARWISEW